MWPYQINNWPDFAYSDEIECKLNGHVLETEVIYSTEGISPVVRGTFVLRALPAPAAIKKRRRINPMRDAKSIGPGSTEAI